MALDFTIGVVSSFEEISWIVSSANILQEFKSTSVKNSSLLGVNTCPALFEGLASEKSNFSNEGIALGIHAVGSVKTSN